MALINALELPEVREHIAQFLDKPDQARCLRISRTWHDTFLPIVWRDIRVGGTLYKGAQRGPDLAMLQHHRHFVRVLRIDMSMQDDYIVHYPNLRTLFYHNILLGERFSLECEPESLISMHPTLTTLHFLIPCGHSTESSWRAISEGLPHLRDLKVHRTIIPEGSMNDFRAICSKVHILQLVQTGIQVAADFADSTFPLVRKLEVTLVSGLETMDQVEFIRRFPGVQELVWCSILKSDLAAKQLAQDVADGAWPELERLDLSSDMSDDGYTLVLMGLQRVTRFLTNGLGFGERSFVALRRHFPGLVELNIAHCCIGTAHMLHEIMCSCPFLETLIGDSINASDVTAAGAGAWVCRRMRRLEISVLFMPGQEENLQPKVFEKLSVMTRLEHVVFRGTGRWIKLRTVPDGPDFRLRSGLAKLAVWRQLRILRFAGTVQTMGEEDVEWMLGHWKNLEDVGGVLHMSYGKNEALAKLLRSRGINVS